MSTPSAAARPHADPAGAAAAGAGPAQRRLPDAAPPTSTSRPPAAAGRRRRRGDRADPRCTPASSPAWRTRRRRSAFFAAHGVPARSIGARRASGGASTSGRSRPRARSTAATALARAAGFASPYPARLLMRGVAPSPWSPRSAGLRRGAAAAAATRRPARRCSCATTRRCGSTRTARLRRGRRRRRRRGRCRAPSGALRSNDCLTRSADLDGLPALAARLAPFRIDDSGPAIRPVPVHLGIVTGISDEALRHPLLPRPRLPLARHRRRGPRAADLHRTVHHAGRARPGAGGGARGRVHRALRGASYTAASEAVRVAATMARRVSRPVPFSAEVTTISGKAAGWRGECLRGAATVVGEAGGGRLVGLGQHRLEGHRRAVEQRHDLVVDRLRCRGGRRSAGTPGAASAGRRGRRGAAPASARRPASAPRRSRSRAGRRGSGASPSVKKLISWVRPGVFEARASALRPVSALIRLDLPTFERPAKQTSARSAGGSPSMATTPLRKSTGPAKSRRPASSASGRARGLGEGDLHRGSAPGERAGGADSAGRFGGCRRPPSTDASAQGIPRRCGPRCRRCRWLTPARRLTARASAGSPTATRPPSTTSA